MRLARKKFKQFLKPKFTLPFLIFLLTFFLRIYLLDNNLFFGWEQGRDAWVIKDIIELKKLTLIGPKTDLEGIFHGPFYYYLMAIPYFLGRGNPIIASLFICFLSSLGASLLFFTARKELTLISRLSVALISALSFQAIVFSRWLSNPSLVLPLSIFLLFFLSQKFKETNFPIIIITWGLIFHLELASALFLTPVLIYYYFINFKKINLLFLLKSALILFLIFSPYLLFDFRHHQILSKSFLNFFKTTQASQPISFAFLKELYRVGLREFTLLILPSFPLITKIFLPLLLLIAFLERKKQIAKIVLIWIFSPLVFLIPLRTVPMSQTLIHLGPAFFLLIGLFLEKTITFTKKQFLAIIILIFLLVSNFNYYLETIPENKNFFFRAYQYTFIGDQKKIIDFVYQEAKGEEFYFDYYTFPYWLPQGWTYLFESYGKRKYGYLPSEERTEEFFVIIEPDEVTPQYQEDWYQKLEKETKLLKTFTSGRLKVEKRLLL